MKSGLSTVKRQINLSVENRFNNDIVQKLTNMAYKFSHSVMREHFIPVISRFIVENSQIGYSRKVTRPLMSSKVR